LVGWRFFVVLHRPGRALSRVACFYPRARRGEGADTTTPAQLGLTDGRFVSNHRAVAPGGLTLPQPDADRAALTPEQSERIAETVNEMLENLADFEPRRWFERFRPKPDKDKNKDEEHSEGLASLEAHAEEEEDVHLVDPRDMVPGWEADAPILCIGGRSILDEAAGALLAAVVAKRGLGAEALPPESISPGHITALSNTQSRLVCLSYLDLGSGPAQIRYLVRRLRRILPQGVAIVVAYWSRGADAEQVGAFLESARADAYVTTLDEAVEVCVNAATGKLRMEAPDDSGDDEAKAKSPPAPISPPLKRPTPKGRKPQTEPA
jgi:hypothetical protein